MGTASNIHHVIIHAAKAITLMEAESVQIPTQAPASINPNSKGPSQRPMIDELDLDACFRIVFTNRVFKLVVGSSDNGLLKVIRIDPICQIFVGTNYFLRFFHKVGIISIFLPANPSTEKPMYPTNLFAFNMAEEITAVGQEILAFAAVSPCLIANRYLCNTRR